MSEYELSNEEKSSVIVTHLRNLSYSKYNTEVSIIEEESLTPPSQETITQLNAQLSGIEKKIAALLIELDELTPDAV
jgi:hypothetical protein